MKHQIHCQYICEVVFNPIYVTY